MACSEVCPQLKIRVALLQVRKARLNLRYFCLLTVLLHEEPARYQDSCYCKQFLQKTSSAAIFRVICVQRASGIMLNYPLLMRSACSACSCRYKIMKQLGDGTYGSVWKATNRQTNEVVSDCCLLLLWCAWEVQAQVGSAA